MRLSSYRVAFALLQVKALRDELKKLNAKRELDCEAIQAAYKGQRTLGNGRKYIMQEIRATCPGIGQKKLTEIAMLFNLMVIYSLTGKDGPMDEVECALLSETAVNMTPSPSAWKEVWLPICSRALKVGRPRHRRRRSGRVKS